MNLLHKDDFDGGLEVRPSFGERVHVLIDFYLKKASEIGFSLGPTVISI